MYLGVARTSIQVLQSVTGIKKQSAGLKSCSLGAAVPGFVSMCICLPACLSVCTHVCLSLCLTCLNVCFAIRLCYLRAFGRLPVPVMLDSMHLTCSNSIS